jgi:hypothetical protein
MCHGESPNLVPPEAAQLSGVSRETLCLSTSKQSKTGAAVENPSGRRPSPENPFWSMEEGRETYYRGLTKSDSFRRAATRAEEQGLGEILLFFEFRNKGGLICYDGIIMMTRTQITLEPEMQRRARQRANDLGVSLAEYLRRLVARDLGCPQISGDVASVFDLGSSDRSDIARNKSAMIAEAFLSRDRDGRHR